MELFAFCPSFLLIYKSYECKDFVLFMTIFPESHTAFGADWALNNSLLNERMNFLMELSYFIGEVVL